MLKKYIYLPIIAILAFSCSDLSSEIAGEWILQEESLHSNAKLLISEKDAEILGRHKAQEIEKEALIALIEDVTFFFEDDGYLSVIYRGKQDSWTESGKWSIESGTLQTNLEGDIKKYSIELDEDFMTLKDISTGEIFNFDRKKN